MDKTIAVRLVAKVGQYNQGLASSAAQTRQFGSDVQQSSKRAASAATSLAATSAMAGKAVLLGIGGAMAVSSKAAVEYESAMTGVAKTTDLAGNAFDRANSPLAQFGDRLRGLSMRIPVNVNELARIAELGGQLGVQVPNLIDFTEVIAKMGVTTNLSTEEAATGFARLANIMRTDQGDFDRMGATIVDLGNNFATTESEILSFSIRLAPIGATIGATEAEVLGLSTALTSLGIPAERGGTALQRVFIKMKSAVDSGGQSLESFAEASGMTAEAFSDLFRTSPARAFAALAQGLDNISKSGGNVFQVLTDLELAEQRTVATLLATASGYELVEDAISTAEGAYRDNIALNEEAALRFGTHASQIQLLGNAFQDLKIEIGNSMVGGGGLIAFVDIGREFVGILKDNIDRIGGFTKALGILATVMTSLGLNKVVTSLVAKAVAWKTLRTGVKAGTIAMGGAKTALMLMSTATTVALGAMGALAAVWLIMSANAAELRAQVRALNDEIEGGKDPVEGIINSLREEGVITDELTEALHRNGISVREWVNDIYKAEGEVDGMFGRGTLFDNMAGQAMDKFSPFARDVVSDYNKISNATSEAAALTSGLFEMKKSNVREQIMGLESAANMTYEEIDHLADRMVRFFDMDVSATEIGKWLAGEQQLGPDFGWSDVFVEETRAVEQTFRDVVDNMGAEGEDVWPDLLSAATDSVTEYREHVQTEFEAITEAIRDSFPGWDEYQKQVEIDLGAATASQEAYLEDLVLWRNSVEFFSENASASTFEWIQSLPLETRAALSRMIGTQELRDNLALWDGHFDALMEIEREAMMEEAPRIFREGALLMMQNAIDAVDESDIPNLTGAQYYQGVMIGLQDAATKQGISVQELFQSMNTQDMLDFFTRLGIDLATALQLGFMDGYKNFGNAFGTSVDGVNEKIKKDLNDDFWVSSPSRYTMYIGEMLGEGLQIGWKNSVSGFDMSQPVERAIQPNAAFTPTINVDGGGGSSRAYTFAPTIVNPTTKDLDKDLRRASSMASARAEFGG